MKKNKFWLMFLGAGLAVVFLASANKEKKTKVVEPERAVEQESQPKKIEATNSEGNMKLVGMSKESATGMVQYSFKVQDTNKKTEIPLYETVGDAGNKMLVPENTWSPDYKQVFIKTSGPAGDDYYVFKANGEPYMDGKRFISVADYWNQTKGELRINKITGWAGNDLLMVYTLKEDGSEGPAFWFVISTRKFMQVREF